MADVGRLVRINGRVLDDRLFLRARLSGDRMTDTRDRVRASVEKKIEVAVRGRDQLPNARYIAKRRGELLRDDFRRLAQHACKLKCRGDSKITETAVRRHFDGDGRHVGQPEAMTDSGDDGLLHV